MTLEEFRAKATNWKTEPISCTCQVRIVEDRIWFCDKPTAKAYPAMGGGWMSLCARHGLKHKEAFPIEELISKGERFA